jgi:hypothetical protein
MIGGKKTGGKMTGGKKTSNKKALPAVSAAEFPALRDFVRGYFHQDLADEYGSPEAAARQFCRDTDEQQRKALQQDWASFLLRMKHQPLKILNHALTQELGSAIVLNQADLKRVSKVLL